MKKLIYLPIIAISLLGACKSTKQPVATVVTVLLDCSNKSLSYTADIKSIIETSCSKCHNSNNKGGYNFLTFESVKKSATNGQLLGTIKHQKGFDAMPRMAPKLPQETIDKIECWINNGMKE
jgi:mono/diheme cytochrome c family protein